LRGREIGHWDRIVLAVQVCISSIDSSGSISKLFFSYYSLILTPHSKDFAKKLIVYAIKKIPRPLCNMKSQNCVHEIPHLVPIMRDKPCSPTPLFLDSFSYTLVCKFCLCGCLQMLCLITHPVAI